MSYVAQIPAWIIAVTLIGYTVGIVTLGVLAHRATVHAYDAAARAYRRVIARRRVRDLDYGTCDGMSRSQVATMVDELWSIDTPMPRD